MTTLNSIIFYFILLASGCFSSNAPTEIENINSTPENNIPSFDYVGVYTIPPSSGYGSGVPITDFEVKNNRIIGRLYSPGYDENGRKEDVSELFDIEFKENKKFNYKEITGEEEVFYFFEFKNGKLYLYDNSGKVIHDNFCTLGNTEKDFTESTACDCIFLKNETR
jgi:hypothetical protein